MLDHHLGHPDVAAAVIGAIKAVLEDSDLRTPDHGGVAGAADMTAAIRSALVHSAENKTVS